MKFRDRKECATRQTLNRYAYVRNSPLTTADPTGMDDYCLGLGPPCDDLISQDFSAMGTTYYMDGVEVPANVALGAMGADSAAQCPNNTCSGFGTNAGGQTAWAQYYAFAGGVSGYYSPSDLTNGINEVNGQVMDDTNYGYYLQRTYAPQIASQCGGLSNNLAIEFAGTGVGVNCGSSTIRGGHANFSLTCPGGGNTCWPSPGRYPLGVHIPEPGVAHNDTVSPWTGPFSFSALFTPNFWEHGFVDLIGGQFVPVFAH